MKNTRDEELIFEDNGRKLMHSKANKIVDKQDLGQHGTGNGMDDEL